MAPPWCRPPLVLDPAVWRARALAHAERADALTAGHRARRAGGESHPVEDFLFTYYPTRPARLRRWHPGVGVVLAGAAETERADWRHHVVVGDGVRVDHEALAADRAAGWPDGDTILDLAFGPLWFRLLTRPDHLDEGFAHEVADLVTRALGLREVPRG